jgi:hypothetical protein
MMVINNIIYILVMLTYYVHDKVVKRTLARK